MTEAALSPRCIHTLNYATAYAGVAACQPLWRGSIEYRPSAGYHQLLLLLLWAATPTRTSRQQLLLEATQDGLRFGAVIPPIKRFAAELSWGFTNLACPPFCLRMQMRSCLNFFKQSLRALWRTPHPTEPRFRRQRCDILKK